MLGQNTKDKKKKRHRFHPDNYKGGPVYPADAYRELSKSAFAVWIRLMTFNGDELRSGVSAIAERLGYSEKGGRTVLTELELAGYIGFVEDGPRLAVVLHRKALIELKGTHFIRAT